MCPAGAQAETGAHQGYKQAAERLMDMEGLPHRYDGKV